MLALTATLLTSGMVFAASAPAAYAQQSDVCKGVNMLDENNTSSDCTEDQTNNLGSVMRSVINIFSMLVGAISVIMIVIGGFRYIVSNGDSNGVSGAKNTILYAIVGLVIVLFAQIIVRFVLSNVTGQ